MQIVPQRNAATLLPIIQQHVQAESSVHSDEWAAYNNIQSLPNVAAHNTVNHSLHFVDPNTGVNTQNIESYWNRVIKIKLKKMKGCHAQQLSGYLDEFMWRERFGTKIGDTFDNTMPDIAVQYPV